MRDRRFLFHRFERAFDRGNHLALDGKRLARNPRARRRRMAAAAKLRGDFIHVHLAAFRAQADADQFGFDFLENAGDDDRLNVADVVNETLGVLALAAGAGEIRLLQPEPGDLVAMRQPEARVNIFSSRARASG